MGQYNEFKKYNVIVTGASRGIGRSVGEKFVNEGANVAFLASNQANLEEACRRFLPRRRKKIFPMTVDLKDPVALEGAIERIRSRFSGVDVIINNAGAYNKIGLTDTSSDEIIDQTRLHVCAALRLIQAFSPGMRVKKFGRIVNVSSAAAYIGSESPAYSASKAALVGLTRSLAKDVAIDGITVNVVVPGPVETEMTGSMPEEKKNAFRKKIPSGRFADVEEIADPILFLCSKSASYINGICLHVNGGLYFSD